VAKPLANLLDAGAARVDEVFAEIGAQASLPESTGKQ